MKLLEKRWARIKCNSDFKIEIEFGVLIIIFTFYMLCIKQYLQMKLIKNLIKRY